MKLKRILSVLLVLLLIVSLAGCKEKEEETMAVSFEKKELPIYYKNIDNKGSLDVYYKDGNNQIPFVTLDTWCDLANKIYNEGIGDYPQDVNYKVQASYDGAVVTLSRENGSSLSLNFENNVLVFSDYDRFVAHSYDVSPLELPHITAYDESGNPCYIQRVVTKYNWTNGNALTVDLNEYSISLYRSGEMYYVPLQTLSDLLINMQYCNILYNTQAVYAIDYETSAAELGSTPTGLMADYYTDTASERSEELIRFTYNELCLLMDYTYGNKEAHGIEDFDSYFSNTYNGGEKSLKDYLLSDNVYDFELGMSYLVNVDLNDLHSSYMTATSYAGYVGYMVQAETGQGTGNDQIYSAMRNLRSAQSIYYPEGCPAYEEIGNTAFIYFNNFIKTEDNHYEGEISADIYDTIELMAYAYQQIYREGSPVENVVLDLSLNTGGYEDALCYVCGMFTGEFTCSMVNPITGTTSNSIYRIDANLDHNFDDYDWFFNKNLYCITSGVSFSCGNICPSILKENGNITMLGRRSDGGNCIVAPFTTASGGWYATSAAKKLVRNHLNSYYQIDEGVEVDYRFDDYTDFYNRPAIVDFINNIVQ